MHLSAQQIETLSGDPATLARAKKLAAPLHWRAPGRSERALWAEHKGSDLYQVRVDLRDLASRCSCPVRQQPCKHALGLLLYALQRPGDFAAAAEPAWVTEWLDRRQAAAERKVKAAEEPKARPPDAKAQQRRAEARQERVTDGLDLLDTWLADLVRVGLAAVEARTPTLFEDAARRLVDAQARGLAGRVSRLAAIPLATPDWQRRLLGELGRLALLTHAFRRLDALDPDLQQDVRLLVGFSLGQDEVLARGDRVRDRWQLVGQVTAEDELLKLRSRRTWLLGQQSGRAAQVLHFTPTVKGARFGEPLFPGSEIDAELAFYPGAARERALIVEREGAPAAITALAGGPIAPLLERASAALARQPWMERFLGVLRVAPTRGVDGALVAIDAAGDHLPIAAADPYLLLALSGGAPIDLAAEWDGEALIPLGAAVDGRFVVLHPSAAAGPPEDAA